MNNIGKLVKEAGNRVIDSDSIKEYNAVDNAKGCVNKVK